MSFSVRFLGIAIVSTAWLFSAPALHAQVQSPAPAAPGTGETTNIPDQKLDAAAAAVQQVAKVREDYEQKIAEAPQPEKERVAAEGNNALLKAVTDQGLSVEEFNRIIVAANNNPDVRQKIIDRIRPSR
jgi:hypothetical protein